MTLNLYNTATRRKEPFAPRDPKNVRIYVCGPTVHQRIHIGNARPLIVFDVLFRLLRHLHRPEHVTYVHNITDIDDKIINQAAKDGEDIRELTVRTSAQFLADWEALGCLPATFVPRATDFIAPRPDGRASMIELISRLIERGHAYAADGHVLFDVPSAPSYGRLSGRSLDEMRAGARVEVAPYKRDPADFVLWKPSTPDQPGWDSPWGRGRPGWHIECSAMGEALLGPLPFDIHGGGVDLVFPHHENEIAQSTCAHAGLADMAGTWMHNGFVTMAGEKMAKSVGNIIRAHEALEMADEVPIRRGEIIRMWMLGTHYRQPIAYSERSVRKARTSLDRFYKALDVAGVTRLPAGRPDKEVIGAIANDLNTVAAFARLHEITSELYELFSARGEPERVKALAVSLRASGLLLGVLQRQPDEWLHGDVRDVFSAAADLLDEEHGAWIEKLIVDRREARNQKDYTRADEIRRTLWDEAQVIVEDRPDGTTEWRRA